MITLRTAGAEWLVDATRDGTTITEGAAVSAEAVQAVADHLHEAKLSGAVDDVATLMAPRQPSGWNGYAPS